MEMVEGRVHVGTDPPEGVPAYGSVEEFVASLDETATPGTVVQTVDARYVAGRTHIETAVEHANRSMERAENVADDRAVEILCYAAGRRQISQALEMGVGTGTTSVIVVVDGPEEETVAERVESTLDREKTLDRSDPERIATFFSVTEREREATDASLQTLVCERVALLDVEK